MDESIANLVQQLGELKELLVLSHITPKEHSALAVAFAFNRWAKISVLNEFITKYLLLSPARGGTARKQLTKIGTAALGPPASERTGFLDRIRSWASRGRSD